METNTKRGFTLMELLVVIAIIGILASVVLASLSTARNKGKTASAISSLSQIRAQAELGVDSSGKYLNNLCNATTGTGNIGALKTAVTAQGTAAGWTCNDDDTDDATATVLPTVYAVQYDLQTIDSGAAPRYYCVDSTGFSGTRTTALGTGTVCPAT